jgi:hypothetical protein
MTLSENQKSIIFLALRDRHEKALARLDRLAHRLKFAGKDSTLNQFYEEQLELVCDIENILYQLYH